jgi:iron complex outermembrane receptor protein
MGTPSRFHLRSALLAGIAVLGCSSAGAQDAVVELPDVTVTGTRLITPAPGAPPRERVRRVAPRPTPPITPTTPAGAPGTAPGLVTSVEPSGILTGTMITGASSTVITATDIQRSPGVTLQEILSREPGVQVTNLFGGVNGARSVVDMRGFGAAASSNTLILVNGRRINDLDLVGVDLASIPRESIERIEVTRGNSGAVLYGDGAVGGVINIVTKTGVALPTKVRVESAIGSFKYREGIASVTGSNGPWSASIFSNAVNSDGYRVNNFYRQLNGVGDFRYTTDEGSVYLNLSADSSWLGLPGARRVEPSIGLNELITDRAGARTPFDWADKKGQNATLGVTRMLAPGAELIVDGGVRHKAERAEFHGSFFNVSSSDPRAAVDTGLTTISFTPRIRLESNFGGMPWKAIGGVDYYHAKYDSDRPLFLGAAPIHVFDLAQSTVAGYWQQTVSVLPSTDIGAGARIQGTSIRARDTFDPNAPGAIPVSCFPPFGCFGDLAGIPLDRSEVNQAFHLGFEHRFNPVFSVFGRAAKSFRVPNVDERVGMVTSLNAEPTTFDLRTQKSHDFEVGMRVLAGPVNVQWSIYDMYLTDEIHFRFGPNFVASNTNLDPTRRYGQELIGAYTASDTLRFKAGVAYTRSVFREGIFAGNDVPLVSRWTGNIGVSWDIVPKWLTFDGVVRYIGERRMDNDQTNLQPLIPAHTLVDVRLGGAVENYFWSVSIQNLFNVNYFDYAIASPFPFGAGSQLGTFNAYPQPGRTYMVKAGATF